MAKINTSYHSLSFNKMLLRNYFNCHLQNGEAELFLVNNEVYKIFESYLATRKQKLMEFLHDNNLDLPISINNLFYENNEFIGYSMEFYKNYNTLYDVLKSNISLKERCDIALELVNIYEKLINNKIVYYDFHSKNILLNKDIKLLDVDSSYYKVDKNYDIQARRNLLLLIITILTGVDFNFDYEELDKTQVLNTIIGNNDLTLDFIRKNVAYLAYDLINYQNELILSKQM